MSKTIRIGKWGPSLAVRIPQYIVDNLELEAGDLADLSYQASRILIGLHKKETPNKLKTPAEEFDEESRRLLHELGVPGY